MMSVGFLCHSTLDPGLKAARTERRAAFPGPIEVLQVSCPAVRADNRSGPGGTPRPILGLPCAQPDGLLIEQQLQLRTALEVRSPVLLRQVDPVQRGLFCKFDLEGVEMCVIVENEITLESFTALQLA